MPISIGAYWLEQPKAKAFREMLPMMGVNGSLANNCKTCPAKGKVFAKTGTVGLSDFVNVGLVDNQSLGGFQAGCCLQWWSVRCWPPSWLFWRSPPTLREVPQRSRPTSRVRRSLVAWRSLLPWSSRPTVGCS